MIPIVAHGIMGTAYRQNVVAEGNGLDEGSLKALFDVRRYLSVQYGDNTPMDSWAFQLAPKGMWISRIERAFDGNYNPAFIAISFLIPSGRIPQGDDFLNPIIDTLTQNHSKYIRQSVIQEVVDWSFLEDLATDLEPYLDHSGPMPPKPVTPQYGIAYSPSDISTMLHNLWDSRIAQCRMVFCGRRILAKEKQFISLEDIPQTTGNETASHPSQNARPSNPTPQEELPHSFDNESTQSSGHSADETTTPKGNGQATPKTSHDTKVHTKSVAKRNKKRNRSYFQHKKSMSNMMIVGGAVAIVVALVVLRIWGNRGEDEISNLRDTMISQNLQMLFSPCYCGDSLFFKAKETKQQYEELAKNNAELTNDSVYIDFCNSFAKQSDYRIQDSTIFFQAIDLFDAPANSFQNSKWDQLMQDSSVLSKEHRDTLSRKWQEHIQKLEAEGNAKQQAEEDALYNKCMNPSGTIQNCNQFLTKYPHSIHKADVEKRKKELIDKLEEELYAKCMGSNATVQDCDKYLANFKDKNSQHYQDVTRRKKKMSEPQKPETSEQSPNNSSSQRITLDTPYKLFNALTYDNIVEGNFDEKYAVANRLEKRKNNIIEKAKKMSRNSYSQIYLLISSNTQIQNREKLTELEKRLKLT